MAAGKTAGPSTTLRSGRDDNSVETGIDATKYSCHPNRRDHGRPTQDDEKRLSSCSCSPRKRPSPLSSRPERSVVEGPAVQRSFSASAVLASVVSASGWGWRNIIRWVLVKEAVRLQQKTYVGGRHHGKVFLPRDVRVAEGIPENDI